MGPVHQYFTDLVDLLQADYPTLPFRVRSDDGIFHLECNNLDIEVGFTNPEPRWTGADVAMTFTGYMQVIWRHDRPEHHSRWTAQSMGHAFTAWMFHRALPGSNLIARGVEVLETETETTDVVYSIVWDDEVLVTAQFEYEGHLIGPEPVLDTRSLGIVESVELTPVRAEYAGS